jgi:CNT family concentrative nucleoside transporter
MNDATLLRAISGVGFLALIAVAWLFSSARGAIDRRTLGWGIAAQFVIAFALLRTPAGHGVFSGSRAAIEALLRYTNAGTSFVFGPLLESGFSFALGVLPIIIFMGSVFGVLYFLGIVQPIVRGLAWILSKSMRTSGAESLAAIANVFVGLIESGVVVGPYLARMTRSELFAFMTLGMSTIAGSVLIAYAQILGAEGFGGHLVIASLISAPAGLVVAKIMVPETGTPETTGKVPPMRPSEATNLIDAAAEGGLVGLRLALNIGALLIAFVALVALANELLGAVAGLFGWPELTFQWILGWLCSPLALLMGIPWSEAREVGSLLGVKTVLNEFLAYQDLAQAIAEGRISPRSAMISTYALCGFANFGSLAILLGGIEGLAPERRAEAAQLGLRSIGAGTLATCMTGCLAGLLA